MKFWSKYKIFIHENASENIICKKASILSTGRWGTSSRPGDTTCQHRFGSTLAQVMVCASRFQAINQSMLTNHQWGLVAFSWGQDLPRVTELTGTQIPIEMRQLKRSSYLHNGNHYDTISLSYSTCFIVISHHAKYWALIQYKDAVLPVKELLWVFLCKIASSYWIIKNLLTNDPSIHWISKIFQLCSVGGGGVGGVVGVGGWVVGVGVLTSF